MELTNEEKIQKLREAQEKLFDVIEAIEEVFPDDEIKTFLINRLRIHASDEHGFMSHDPNLSELIGMLGYTEGSPRKVRKKKK